MDKTNFFGKPYGKRFLLGFLPLGWSNDIVSKDPKIAQDIDDSKDLSETGWDRLRMMFSLDEFDHVSAEVNSIYQAGFLGFLVGAIYGGVMHSKSAYINFLENNEATAFKSHLEAKKKLQDTVTVNFAKGGFKWGWRVALFTSSYVGISTCISVYRGKSSMYEYVAAGTITGAAYKMSLGLRGMAVGGLLGCILGTVGGGLSLALLTMSGTTMEEVRYWQYKWKLSRNEAFQSGIKKANQEKQLEIERLHDEKVGKDKISLDKL